MLDEPLLLREEGSGTRVILEYYLKERGLAAADFARTVEIGNIGAIKTLPRAATACRFSTARPSVRRRRRARSA